MQSITAEYLTGIITKYVSKTICVRRNLPAEYFNPKEVRPTNDEISDFILSIPYFDERLKDFLFGNLAETAIIISQIWEIEFIKRCDNWANNEEWLKTKNTYLKFSSQRTENFMFTLPY
jgi:hypothetical protein